MKRLCLYVETSVFGFYYDEKLHNVHKRKSTKMLIDQIRLGIFEAFVSPTTLAELSRMEGEEEREKLLSLVDENEIKFFTFEQGQRDEIFRLAEIYVARKAIPAEKFDDGIHVASLVVVPGFDVLVTWNCTHLANVLNKRLLKALTFEQGYTFDFEIATPEEVIEYEK